MKILMYINNSGVKDISFKDIEKGNPGVGGTIHMMLKLGLLLNENHHITIAAPKIENLPNIFYKLKCNSLMDLLSRETLLFYDFIILRGPIISREEMKAISLSSNKFILWCHNFETGRYADWAAQEENIVANVCVSKQQLERLIDHELWNKSTYIYNGIEDIYRFKKDKTKFSQEINLVYIGTLSKKRGFNHVVKVWKALNKVDKKYKLNIIGGDNLYNQNKEANIPKEILGKNGKLLDGIKFHGVLGLEEKIKVLKKMDIGFAPSKKETFGISTIEMQAMGIPVIGIKSYGNVDTLADKDLIYCSDFTRTASKKIQYLVKNQSKYQKSSLEVSNYVYTNFDFDQFTANWVSLLSNINSFNCLYKEKFSYENLLINSRVIRILNAKLSLPSLLKYRKIYENFKLIKEIK